MEMSSRRLGHVVLVGFTDNASIPKTPIQMPTSRLSTLKQCFTLVIHFSIICRNIVRHFNQNVTPDVHILMQKCTV